MSDRWPTVVSLFTGAGGLDIGLERAGFRTAAAVESDDHCVATLNAAKAAEFDIPTSPGYRFLAETTIIAKRIEQISLEDFERIPPASSRPPDLVVGGPPCQPFSSSGQMRSVADPRGRLFEEFVRVAALLRPRFILFENVRGLVTAKGPRGEPGEALSMVKRAFEGIGYGTRFALLNAADYGSAQRRVRCFMLAARNGPLPEFPEPTHAETPGPSLFETRQPWVPLGEFLSTQPEPLSVDIIRPSAQLATRLAALPSGTGLKSAGAREATRPGGHWGYRQGTFIANLSLPARTITASASQDWIRLPDGTLRRLTWAECAALQGFPSGWPFQGGKASRFAQIGNAVPVIFGEVLGRSLLRSREQSSVGAAPTSAPLPAEFITAIDYTRKEHRRNGASRSRVLELQRRGRVPVRDIKGTGSAEARGA